MTQRVNWSRRQVLGGATLLAATASRSPIRGAHDIAAAPARQAAEAAGLYTAYVPVPEKQGQFAQYTCEFDAAWMVLKTFGLDVPLEEQVAIVGVDRRVEPYEQLTADGYVVYGGDIGELYSGDYTSSYLARSTSRAMRKVFDHFGLAVEPVADRAGIEAALDRGALVWMKSTVDFLPWEPVATTTRSWPWATTTRSW
jgi:hypothetical protein